MTYETSLLTFSTIVGEVHDKNLTDLMNLKVKTTWNRKIYLPTKGGGGLARSTSVGSVNLWVGFSTASTLPVVGGVGTRGVSPFSPSWSFSKKQKNKLLSKSSDSYTYLQPLSNKTHLKIQPNAFKTKSKLTSNWLILHVVIRPHRLLLYSKYRVYNVKSIS